MADRLEAVDVVTVAENLRNAGYLDKIGGTAELQGWLTSVPTSGQRGILCQNCGGKGYLEAPDKTTSTEIAATAYDSQM